ncbi:hypothetical protein KBC04_02325 [Candidatus Babeliales bacterium]|nr:hypothetical protein [Candidatus Babeliales bacterium]MBP9843754.1 hypothetical protein [Candidatus Babeliales bacterium]
MKNLKFYALGYCLFITIFSSASDRPDFWIERPNKTWKPCYTQQIFEGTQVDEWIIPTNEDLFTKYGNRVPRADFINCSHVVRKEKFLSRREYSEFFTEHFPHLTEVIAARKLSKK